ncbi:MULTISPECIES: hypothetical protein [Staphylococcus]|uniref:DUF350 domain-containing protein n=1 Tax=Staphylococcus hsinchuensis TaxID=3051183 RepID=A0ABZ3EAT6_9STAP|nr:MULTISPECIES: hypothetical protein [unclassified Staphylococcus]
MLFNSTASLLAIGFLVFGISAMIYMSYEMYKALIKSHKKMNLEPGIYTLLIAAVCGIALLVIMTVPS